MTQDQVLHEALKKLPAGYQWLLSQLTSEEMDAIKAANGAQL